MVFEFIAGGWKSMKQYFGFNNIIADSRHVANIDVIGQNVHGPEHDVQMSSNDHSNGWKNTVSNLAKAQWSLNYTFRERMFD